MRNLINNVKIFVAMNTVGFSVYYYNYTEYIKNSKKKYFYYI